MSFKKNLLKKIEIDEMTGKILKSIGPIDSGLKLDRQTMRKLLEISSYKYIKERDLDLYIKESKEEKNNILVLDNDLPIYFTTVKDVALRKSPTIKEMISIRNAIKILNDSDVLISKKEESLKTLRKECIDLLDFSFDREDIDEIANQGIISLERGYIEGIKESLALFAEILRFKPVPKTFEVHHYYYYGNIEKKSEGQYMAGVLVIYGIIENSLKLIEDKQTKTTEEIKEFIKSVSAGDAKAKCEGPEVYKHLSEMAYKIDFSNWKPADYF